MAEVEWLHSPERGGECGLTVQGDTRGKPLGPHGQEPKSRSRDQVRCAEPDGGAWNATIGARVLRRMSFSARFAASANYATTPLWARSARGHRIQPAFSRAASAAREVPIGMDQAGNPQPHDRSRHDARNLDSFLRTLGRKTSERRFRSARLHITSRKICFLRHPRTLLISASPVEGRNTGSIPEPSHLILGTIITGVAAIVTIV